MLRLHTTIKQIIFLILIIFIHSAHLPPVTIGVGEITEPLDKIETIVGKWVLLVKRYGALDSVST